VFNIQSLIIENGLETRLLQTLHPTAECCGSQWIPWNNNSTFTDLRLNVLSKVKWAKDASTNAQSNIHDMLIRKQV